MTQERRVAVVTGSSGGIGGATVDCLTALGWRVVAVDCRSPVGQTQGARFTAVDLGEPAEIRRLFRDIGKVEGRVDALVNNAAVQLCCPFEEVEVDAWDRTMAVNVRAAAIAIQEALPLFSDEAAVVNVGSVHAFATSIHMAVYAASKGALAALTRALAIELAPRGIRVNMLAPGAVDTTMLRAGLERGNAEESDVSARLELLAKRTPCQRVATPREIAELVALLADTERSGFVTGQTLVADGGALAMLGTELDT